MRAAEKARVEGTPARGYLPIEGVAAYNAAVQQLLFGADSPLIAAGRVATFECLGGTGGLKIGADFIRRLQPGARVWISEILERDGVDATAALFSESTGRMLVSVPREDDVKFKGLCEGRGYPVLRIGVTEDSGALELQDLFTVEIDELRAVHRGTLAAAFGPVVGG